MSQKRRTRKRLSQPSTSLEITHDEIEDVNTNRSQSQRNKTFSEAEHLQHVTHAVRYILGADQFKTPISRAVVSKAIECSGAGFKAVMDSVEKVLEDVFGYRIVNIINNEVNSGKFMVVNKIQGALSYDSFDKEVGDRYVLLFLVLSHIFMNGEISSEASLIRFLQTLGIIEEGSVISGLYGNVLNLITNDFVKERYLRLEANKNSEIQEKDFLWGERALQELSPRDIMEYACKIYGDREPQNWHQQYKRMQALEQKYHSA